MKLIALIFLVLCSATTQGATWTPSSRLLPDGTACTVNTNLQLRWNNTSNPKQVEVCYWNGSSGVWNPALPSSGGSNGALSYLPDGSACTATTAYQVRWNIASQGPETCVNGSWVAQAVSIGGTYGYTAGGTCVAGNPYTGTCSCPSGYRASLLWRALEASGNSSPGYGYICYK